MLQGSTLLTHAGGEGQKKIADGRMGRLPGQQALGAKTVADAEENDNEEEEANIEVEDTETEQGGGEGPSEGVKQKQINLRRMPMDMTDQVGRAEIVWTLQEDNWYSKGLIWGL